MKTFTLDLNAFVSVTVYFDLDQVTVWSEDYFEPSEVMKAIDEGLKTELRESYPNDWDLIMVKEDYGMFFTLGSPQVMECGWKLKYETDQSETKLTVTGLS